MAPIPIRAEFQRFPFWGVSCICLHPLTQNEQIRTYGEGVFYKVSQAIAFAQMRRAVCQQ